MRPRGHPGHRPGQHQRSAEVLLQGVEGALNYVKERGGNEVVVGLRNATVHGYLRKGWRPRSIAMLRALRLVVDAAQGMNVEFRSSALGRRRPENSASRI